MPSLRRHQLEITNPLGLHVRAASRFVEVAKTFDAQVRVLCGERVADGKSILDLMVSAIEYGAWVDLEVIGPDAVEALEALSEVIVARFDEGRQVEDPR
jgi:phosphotransferase system HPr (HPr) family protein